MTQSIVRNLLRLALGENLHNSEICKLKASNFQWQPVLMELKLNRIAPSIAYTLEKQNLSDRIPASSWQKMQCAYRQTRMLNTFLFLTLYRIVQALEQANLHPVACPKIVLADSLYPDLGARSLNNIDLLVSVDEIAEARVIVESLGFTLIDRVPTSNRLYFCNSFGIICKLQVAMSDLLDRDGLGLTMQMQPQHIQLPTLTVLEPNAMLVELIVRISDRSAQRGISLQQILDVALFLEKWGSAIDPQQLQTLMPKGNYWQCLWRIVKFLESQLDRQIPTWLSQAAQNADPIVRMDNNYRFPRLARSQPQPALALNDLILQTGN
jgi:hypothetical protein